MSYILYIVIYIYIYISRSSNLVSIVIYTILDGQHGHSIWTSLARRSICTALCAATQRLTVASFATEAASSEKISGSAACRPAAGDVHENPSKSIKKP